MGIKEIIFRDAPIDIEPLKAKTKELEDEIVKLKDKTTTLQTEVGKLKPK